MDIFTKTYLNIINQQTEISDQQIKNIQINNAKRVLNFKKSILFTEELKNQIYNWLKTYFQQGTYLTFYINQNTYLYIDDQPYDIIDKKNGFKLYIYKEQYTYKLEEYIIYKFPEQFNKNDIQHVINILEQWFNEL